jgi:predicted  nucleic acid-binding Zn-ribbon protein
MSDEQLETSSQDVERIRDIIFGNQMRDYHQRFEAFQRDLAQLQQQLDRLSEQLAEQDSHHSKKVQSLRQEMRQADDALRSELRETARKLTADKVEKTELGHLFLEIGTHLTEGRSVSDLLKGLAEKEQA